jgi:hypothetical protein
VKTGSVLALLLTLSACSPKAGEAPATYLDLDCKQPFDAQVATLIAQPKLDRAGSVGSEPYIYYSAADGSVSYLITRPGSPAHPGDHDATGEERRAHHRLPVREPARLRRVARLHGQPENLDPHQVASLPSAAGATRGRG